MKTKKEIHDHRIYMVIYFVWCNAVIILLANGTSSAMLNEFAKQKGLW